MKVLKEGEGWKKVLICKGCKSELEIEEDDILYKITDKDISNQQYNIDILGTFYINCIICGQELDLKTKDIPPLIQSRKMEQQ